MKVNTKIRNLIQKGERLHELPDSIQFQIITDILYSYQLRGRYEAFEKNFLKAFISFCVYNDVPVNGQQLERVKVVLRASTAIGKHYTMNEFIAGLMLKEYKEPKQEKLYKITLQNAVVYSVAATYKAVIVANFMRAKNARPGTKLATHSNSAYENYMKQSQPLLSAFVNQQHKFWDTQILAIMGYIINPSLEEV